MEWIGPILIGLIVFGSLVQLFWAYAISAIAKKTEQSELMQVLAWIPLLQIAPTLAAGGGSLGRFLIGGFALLIGNAALVGVAVFLGSRFGQIVAGLGLGLSGLLCLIYFVRIARNTATARNLPAWMGILLFVPVVNLFVYPYFAFHDGWTRPNMIGAVIGLVLMLGGMAPIFQLRDAIEQEGGLTPKLLAAMSNGGSQLLDDSDDQAMTGWVDLNSQSNSIEALDRRGPNTATASTLGPEHTTATFVYGSVPPDEPLPVQASESCPSGTETRTRQDEESEEEWCQQLPEYGGLRHGWYARYDREGRPESMGQYETGLRVGIWTRFFPSGQIRAQAQFHDGMQHGWVLVFDEAGQRTKAARFELGTRVAAR